eukprot:GEMP01094140.1.p1 GENE.GEMP01094140.1~~GEMP01094140.1.p1  ORF type:complete len:110 (-),score=8.55 GEMP01094140.1:190-519(-)
MVTGGARVPSFFVRLQEEGADYYSTCTRKLTLWSRGARVSRPLQVPPKKKTSSLHKILYMLYVFMFLIVVNGSSHQKGPLLSRGTPSTRSDLETESGQFPFFSVYHAKK